MARIDEEREAQRVQEQRRLEDQQRAKVKTTDDQFRKLVQHKQSAGQQLQKGQQQAKAKNMAQAQASSRGRASAALMARSGIDARALNRALQEKTDASAESARVDGMMQHDEQVQSIDRAGDRQDGLQGDARQEEHREEHRLEHDRLAAISGDESRDRNMGGEAGDGGGSMGGQAQQGGVAQPVAAQAAAAPHVVTIPQAMIEALVNRVYAGVTPGGKSQFIIELNSNVLGGARVEVTSDQGKISCAFHTDDKNVGRLVKASEGALARAFAHKGLTLERLEVVQR